MTPSLRLWISVALCMPAVSFAAQVDADLEHQVKAAMLLNFAKFVDWPKPGPQLSICLLGSDPFGPILDRAIEGKAVNGRSFVIRRGIRPSEAAGCDVAYVGPSESKKAAEILSALSGKPVLTVSDIPRFADGGGVIGLVEQNGRIAFEVNLRSAQAGGLTIRSQMLKLARVVDAPARGAP